MLDTTKPVQMRDGGKARILATDLNCKYQNNIVAAVFDTERETEVVRTYLADGRYVAGSDFNDRRDLVNVPQPKSTFLNVYVAGDQVIIYDYDTLEAASSGKGNTRLGVVKITVLDGKITTEQVA